MKHQLKLVTSGRDIDATSILHHEILYWTLNSQIGITHLPQVYRTTASDASSRVVSVFIDDVCVGSGSITWNYKQLRSCILRQNIKTYMTYLLRHPIKLFSYLKSALFVSSELKLSACDAYLLTWFVSEKYRKIGVGSEILTSLYQELPSATKNIYVDVDFNAESALKSYYREGFSMIGKGRSSWILAREIKLLNES
jgi:hypothetical protein